MLNIFLPVFGYTFWAHVICHVYSRYALKKLKGLTHLEDETSRWSHLCLTSTAGAIDFIRPGNACLWCYQFLNSARIATESLPPEEREKRMSEGYVQDVDTPSPSVISLTTTISGFAVTLVLQLLTNFMSGKESISRLRYDALTGLIHQGKTPIDQNCSCISHIGLGHLFYCIKINRICMIDQEPQSFIDRCFILFGRLSAPMSSFPP